MVCCMVLESQIKVNEKMPILSHVILFFCGYLENMCFDMGGTVAAKLTVLLTFNFERIYLISLFEM